jgi:hypothetical protein
MKRYLLLAYQWGTGLCGTVAGASLYVRPAAALSILGLHAPTDSAPYIGCIGALTLSVGMASLYGAVLMQVNECIGRIEMVWLLTAFSRASMTIYLLRGIAAGNLETAWMNVAVFDAACVILQGVGLRRRWLRYAQEHHRLAGRGVAGSLVSLSPSSQTDYQAG